MKESTRQVYARARIAARKPGAWTYRYDREKYATQDAARNALERMTADARAELDALERIAETRAARRMIAAARDILNTDAAAALARLEHDGDTTPAERHAAYTDRLGRSEKSAVRVLAHLRELC